VIRFGTLCLLLALAIPAAHAACPDVAVEFMEAAISPAERERLAQDLREAVRRVCAFWGPTFAGRLAIDVTDAVPQSMALVPAWRGRPGYIVFPVDAVRRSRAPVIHEVVHLFAPNGSRFLAEGLAVHVQDRLGGVHVFPNFGRDLDRAAGRHAGDADIVALDRLPTPAMLQLAGILDRQAAYLASGSFVRYVIEQHGMNKFRQLYTMTPLVPGRRNPPDPGRWLAVYGVALDQLAQAWRGRLARAP